MTATIEASGVVKRYGKTVALDGMDLVAQPGGLGKDRLAFAREQIEERGLIFRCHVGRANALYLTEEGKRLRRETVPAEEARIAAQFGALTVPERRELLRLLRLLDHALE